MGVLNITPDSFSDGGFFIKRETALAQARLMVEQGAAIIDIGGESTRPGAEPVSEQEELDRVIPVIEFLQAEFPVIVSIDTSKAKVMEAAVAAGAGLINDVRALREEGALASAVGLDAAVCLMHMQGEPRTMQAAPVYADVVADVKAFLSERIVECEQAGLSKERLLIDPGFGFGKTPQHNLSLIKHLHELKELHCPILVGVSRKSTIGQLLDRPVTDRLAGSLALAVMAVSNGAQVVRAHDVAATVDALKMVTLVKQA